MQKPIINLTPAIHNNCPIIKISFAKNDIIQTKLRQISSFRWSKTHNSWYFASNSCSYIQLNNLLKEHAYVDYSAFLKTENKISEPEKIITASTLPIIKKPAQALSQLSEAAQKKVKAFEYWLNSKRYSANTIATYLDALKVFLRYYSAKTIEEINNEDLINFNNDYILKNKFSASFQNQVVNAVKLFFAKVADKLLQPELVHRPKRPKVLPNVLSKEEVKLILNVLKNIKHKTMLSLIYSCGLRRNELLNLKLTDVDSIRHLLIIRQAKGRKDRVTPLSEKTIELLRIYFAAYKPKEWLFEGQGGRGQYDGRSLGNVLSQALDKCLINKPVTLHWLRHSYATHLLENGTDLRYIQEILGHSRSTTTEIYTHVSTKGIQNVVSPFDHL